MDFFLDQGRCRVCGRIFCCSAHQKRHESVEHAEYGEWLDMLPVCCRRCGKRLSIIADLSSKCVLFNRRHCFAGNSLSGTPKPSRKRRLDENLLRKNVALDENADLRRRLVPSRQQFPAKGSVSSSNLFLFDGSGARIEAAIDAIISPQLSVSYKVLKTDAKSSTPLTEDEEGSMCVDKENVAVVSVSVQHDATAYCTPENPIGPSVILVSAMRKTICSSTRRNRRSSDGRRVTFEAASDGEISVYGSPAVSFTSEVSKETTFTHEMVIVSPAIDENLDSPADSDLSNEPSGEPKLAKMAKNLRLTLLGIPRSLTSIWEWTQRRICRKKKRDEFDDSVSLRNETKVTLKRRPISSYWVSMSITSMVRDPLPGYKEKYTAVQQAE